MKNIFKFMGIALVAGGLFVACNPKDDDIAADDTLGNREVTDTNAVIDTTNTQPQTEGSYTLMWNGEAQNLPFTNFQKSRSVLYFIAANADPRTSADFFPAFNMYFIQGEDNGEQGMWITNEGFQVTLQNQQNYYADKIYPCDIFESGWYGGVILGDSVARGDYRFFSFNGYPAYTNVDFTNFKYSASFDMKYYSMDDLYEKAATIDTNLNDTLWYAALQELLNTTVLKKDVVLTFDNYTWSE